MRHHAVFDRFRLLAAAAAVGAHANARAEGFRLRDIHFLLDLICNWLESAFGGKVPVFQRTQIQRYLKELEGEGYVRVLSRAKRPLYRLTRSGLIELIAQMVQAESYERPEFFFFIYYFIQNYRPKVLELVRQEGKQFPYALELELQALLDVQALLKRETQRIERELRKLDALLKEAKDAARLTAECLMRGMPYEAIVERWQKEYPYGLNSQKPLVELFSEISPDIAKWELETGNAARARDLWAPNREILASYLKALTQLADTAA